MKISKARHAIGGEAIDIGKSFGTKIIQRKLLKPGWGRMKPNRLLHSLLEGKVRLDPSWWKPSALHPHPRLNHTDLQRLRRDIVAKGGDPLACGLPPPRTATPSPVIQPKEWPLWYLRKYQK